MAQILSQVQKIVGVQKYTSKPDTIINFDIIDFVYI